MLDNYWYSVKIKITNKEIDFCLIGMNSGFFISKISSFYLNK